MTVRVHASVTELVVCASPDQASRAIFDAFSTRQWVAMPLESGRGVGQSLGSLGNSMAQALSERVLFVNLTRQRRSGFAMAVRATVQTRAGSPRVHDGLLRSWIAEHRDDVYVLPCALSPRVDAPCVDVPSSHGLPAFQILRGAQRGRIEEWPRTEDWSCGTACGSIENVHVPHQSPAPRLQRPGTHHLTPRAARSNRVLPYVAMIMLVAISFTVAAGIFCREDPDETHEWQAVSSSGWYGR